MIRVCSRKTISLIALVALFAAGVLNTAHFHFSPQVKVDSDGQLRVVEATCSCPNHGQQPSDEGSNPALPSSPEEDCPVCQILSQQVVDGFAVFQFSAEQVVCPFDLSSSSQVSSVTQAVYEIRGPPAV